MTERDELISAISDTYKEAHGVRPRFYNFSAMSVAELREEYDRLYGLVSSELRREREHNEAVYAALDDPDCLVVVRQPYADDMEYVISCIAHDDLSIFRVYRQEPAPANTALADALRVAMGG